MKTWLIRFLKNNLFLKVVSKNLFLENKKKDVSYVSETCLFETETEKQNRNNTIGPFAAMRSHSHMFEAKERDKKMWASVSCCELHKGHLNSHTRSTHPTLVSSINATAKDWSLVVSMEGRFLVPYHLRYKWIGHSRDWAQSFKKSLQDFRSCPSFQEGMVH